MTAQALANITRRPVSEIEQWIAPLQHTFERFGITTQEQRAMFLGQIALESTGFTRLEENLNYNAGRLLEVFPKYFNPPSLVHQYARQPEKIANRVYANRMGNGDESSGDGWKYRGRGLKQLTGKWNYEKCGKSLAVNLVQTPDLLLETEYAALSAGWFWHINGLNGFSHDIQLATRRINGGLNGLKDRRILWERARKEVLV